MLLQVWLDPQDLAVLHRRAERVTGGNLSAAIAQLLRSTDEHEARATWLGEVRNDWGTPPARKRRRGGSAQGGQ